MGCALRTFLMHAFVQRSMSESTILAKNSRSLELKVKRQLFRARPFYVAVSMLERLGVVPVSRGLLEINAVMLKKD